MTHIALPHDQHLPRHGLSIKTALKVSWLFWVILLSLPFFFLQALIWYITRADPSRFHGDPQRWFIVAMAYLILVLPGMFFLRGHLFRDYWLGHPVAPGKYVLATVLVGLALSFGGILSLTGCLITGSFMPNLIPGFLALVLFALHWPTGRAMIRPVGKEEDPQTYEEPR